MPEDLIVQRAVCARVPTAVGEFQLCLYKNNHDEKEHLALINGDIEGQSSVLVRIHSECFTGDVLGSQRCDCGEQLRRAMELSPSRGGVLLFICARKGVGLGWQRNYAHTICKMMAWIPWTPTWLWGTRWMTGITAWQQKF